jgi:predicted GIY-YIG superfamily endonuclease
MEQPAKPSAVVCLLHFECPYCGPMQHYVGWTRNLEQRVGQHRAGDAGSATTRRAFDQGIGFVVARAWPAKQGLEQRIKKYGIAKYCLLCRRRSGPSSR